MVNTDQPVRSYCSSHALFCIVASVIYKKQPEQLEAQRPVWSKTSNRYELHHDKRINENKPCLKNFKDDNQDGYQNCKLDVLLKLNLTIYRPYTKMNEWFVS